MRLTDEDVRAMAAFLEVTEHEFTGGYTRLREDRRGLALNEKANGECVFPDGLDCVVQPVKPQQCRDFPNGWNSPGFEKDCRAVVCRDEERHPLRRS
jgi:Fe-S-cluster containining protein